MIKVSKYTNGRWNIIVKPDFVIVQYIVDGLAIDHLMITVPEIVTYVPNTLEYSQQEHE